ncbi:N-acetyltransferase [uncultured Ruegeria sp.]|uniref:GNAT family N-acetyltransferase n=1 Tax=uncultured Ruegeria sp. TaxID=259304 RepID=UPI0026286B5D|nr:GNAT family N-acetyltransferase [uncultured Ruegeria sp.]
MQSLSIRVAVLDDAEAIRTCLGSAYAASMQEITDLPDVTSGIHDDIKSHQVVIAEAGAQLLGVIVFDRQPDAVKIFNLGVSSEAQGRGVARQLLDAAEAFADESDLSILRLSTHRLMSGTRAMYLHLGWREVDATGNTILMEKHLS